MLSIFCADDFNGGKTIKNKRKGEKTMKKRVAKTVLGAALAASMVMTGVTVSAEAPAEEMGFNYTPVENTTGEEVRIATLLVQNNPFWVKVAEGAEDVKTFLADEKYNCTVDIISFDDFDGQEFAEAINTCVVKGYDAICTVGVAERIPENCFCRPGSL